MKANMKYIKRTYRITEANEKKLKKFKDKYGSQDALVRIAIDELEVNKKR